MSTSKIKFLVLFFLVGFSRIASAQTPIPPQVVDDYVDGITADFNRYMGHYMSPILKGLGNGMNNGWYNTAKPHKSFGFDLTISLNTVFVPESDKNFVLDPTKYAVLGLPPNQDNMLPTAMGGTTTHEIRTYLSKGDPTLGSTYDQIDALDGFGEQLPSNYKAVPSPLVQFGVGIYKNTEIKVRWVPTIENIGSFQYKYFGLGVMHSISQWVPVMKNLPFLDVSGFVGFTNVDLLYKVDDDPVQNPNGDQFANFGINTITYEIVGSASFSVITGYIGIGFDSFKTKLNMDGTYNFQIPGVTNPDGSDYRETVEDPVALNAKSSGLKASVGARLKLAILTLHGTYTLQEYNTLNVGIGFSFR